MNHENKDVLFGVQLMQEELDRLRNECADLNLIIATKLNEIAALKKQVEEMSRGHY